jgi:predicted transcriptional regulator of viral defense system
MQNVIRKLLSEGNGVIKAADARLAGVNNKELQRLAERGKLERVSHGLYIDAEHMEDEYLTAQYRCRKGIFSHETALFLHDLSDRTPLRLMMTIPSGYNTRLLKEKEMYRFFYCKPEVYQAGIMVVRSPYGHNVKVYNKERTICDCIKKKEKLDPGLVLEAVKRYMSQSGNDYARLLKYAQMLNIRDIVRQYMEVLR